MGGLEDVERHQGDGMTTPLSFWEGVGPSPFSFYGCKIGPRQAVVEVLATDPGRFQPVHSTLSLLGMTLLYCIAPVTS